MLGLVAVSEAPLSAFAESGELTLDPERLVAPRPGPRLVAPPHPVLEVPVLAFGSKDPDSSEVFTFDFVHLIGDSELTISSASVTNEVTSGIDASPLAMLSGSPQVDGTKVLQRLIGGTDGVAYHPRCLATMSDGGVLVIGADLDVREF